MRAQFVDPRVSWAKFDQEIQEFRALEDTYRRRGWFLARAQFPEVVVVMTAPQLKPPAIVTGVAFDYSNYDAEPPSVLLVDPFTLVPFLTKELPPILHLPRSSGPMELDLPGLPPGAQVQLGSVQTLMQAYSPDEVPFLCLAGVREYHEHPGHSGDPWELHRRTGAGKLVRLLEMINKYGVQPINGYSVQLVPQIGFQQGQPPE